MKFLKYFEMLLFSRKLFLHLSFVLMTPMITVSAYGQVSCVDTFTEQSIKSRSSLASYLREQKIPAVLMPTRNGEIPVILMNRETGPKMKSFLHESIGTEVAHQPGYNNDHGLFRFDEIIADMDAPGFRRQGELHKTGISWVNLQSYLAYGGSSKRIEVAYALNKSEMRTVRVYELMRRAAILRVRFSFGNFKQDANQPNFLNEGGENCFGFCSASYLYSHMNEIGRRFTETGLGDVKTILAHEDVKAWIEKVGEKLLSVNPDSAVDLSPKLPMSLGAPETLAKNEKFIQLSREDQQIALNWLVGFQFSSDYQKLTSDLEFHNTGSGFSGMSNRRATAVLVYDAKTTPQDFVSTNYQSKGIFSIWDHSQARPLN